MKTILFLIVIVFSKFSFAQKTPKNLIPNSSFEIHKGKSADIKNATPWKGVGTVDYFMKTEKKDTSRFKGAHSGTCYVGLRFQPDYKEYMYVQLNEALEKGKTYHFKMFIRLLGSSTVTIKQLGVFFSDDAFKIGMTFDEEGLVDSTFKNGIKGSFNWLPIQGDYISHGGEKFIIIGNFRLKMKDDMVKTKKWEIFELKEAYYYVDDISLVRKKTVNDSTNLAKINKKPTHIFPDTYTKGQKIEIKNLQFEKGTPKILKSSFSVLDELVGVLNNNPFMEIQIEGHSDNSSSEAAKKLSKERAKAVYTYLKAQGVVNPVYYKGYIDTNKKTSQKVDPTKPISTIVEFAIIKEQNND